MDDWAEIRHLHSTGGHSKREIARVVKNALTAAGLEPMTLHDLRHTAASLAISAGANVKAVQRMLGHASAAMTLDTYADLFDDDIDSVAEALDRARMNSDVAILLPKSELAARRKAKAR